MKNNKKSKIIYKSVGFMFFLAVIVMIIILVSSIGSHSGFNAKSNQVKISDNHIGYETFENIKQGIIKVSCIDAKKLGTLFIQINNEISNDNISDIEIQDYAVSSQAKTTVNEFENNFLIFLENYYGQNNLSQAEAVLQAINMEIYENIVQPSIMISTGNISENEFYDYLNIEYCGVIPPASYISPKDVVLYSINNSSGRVAIEELMDNTSK